MPVHLFLETSYAAGKVVEIKMVLVTRWDN